MAFAHSSRSSVAIVLPEPTMAGIPLEPVTGGNGPFFKHQSAFVTEKIDAHGRSSKVESVIPTYHLYSYQFFTYFPV